MSGEEPTSSDDDGRSVGYSTIHLIDQFPEMELLRDAERMRRESFAHAFAKSNGPPQMMILCLLIALAFGSTVGVVPAVMTDRYAHLFHNFTEATCRNHAHVKACVDAASDAQNGVAMEQLISNTFTFATSSYVGALSDEYGRKVVLITGVLFSALSPLTLVLLQLQSDMRPVWYYGAGAIAGLIPWLGVALSTLSDVLPPHWRAPSFGLLLVGFSLGFALAPQLAFFLGHLGVSVLSLAAILVALVLLVCAFPETLPPETARQARRAREEQMQGLSVGQSILWSVVVRPVWELSILNRNRLFRLLSALAFFSGMVSSGDRTLLVYYIEERLSFNDKDIAMMFLILGLLGVFVQGFLIKLFNDWLGERKVVLVAFLFGVVHNLIYAVAQSKTVMFVGIAIGAFVGMSFPTISAIKSNNVEPSEQGRIQGALYSLSALASALGPVAMRSVYQATKDGSFFGPGSMFLLAALMYLVAVYCAYLLPVEADSKKKTSAPGQGEVTAETPLLP